MTLRFHTVVCSYKVTSFDHQGFMDFGLVKCLTFFNYLKLLSVIRLSLA